MRRGRPGRGAPTPVAVFDVELPTGIAFVRSLGRAGVPVVACSPRRMAAGRFSRYVAGFRTCPPIDRTDEFSAWLADQLVAGSIDLVAPTSDTIAFHVAEAADRGLGARLPASVRDGASIRDCLLKDRFAAAMERIGFPVPAWAAPRTIDEALDAAAHLGYPLVAKPRSHVGVGVARGAIVRSEEELRGAFVPYDIGEGHEVALRHDPDLALPLLQAFHEPGTVDVVSVSGCLDTEGRLVALSHSRKMEQWPPRLGIGTRFEATPPHPFTEAAVEAARQLLGAGVFELELLVDRRTGEHWAIDLNPRGFGQMTLDMARGCDLPLAWYRSVTGRRAAARVADGPLPLEWRQTVPFLTGTAVALARGPRRREQLRRTRDVLSTPSVDAAFSWRDPVPGVLHGALFLRHPGGLVRPFIHDSPADPPGGTPMSPTPGHDAPPPGATPPAAPTLTVVIPTFRRERQVVEAIASVLAQDIAALEVLVLDDAPDGSAEEAVTAVGDDRVRYERMPRPSGGVPALVRNHGIGRARGEYLYFLDDDDLAAPGALPAMVDALRRSGAGVAYGRVRCVGPDAGIRARYERWFRWAAAAAGRTRRSSWLTTGVILFRGTTIINSVCMIRTEHARELGGYDPTLPVYEDVEFFARGIRRFGHVFVDRDVLVYSTGLPSLIHDLHGDNGPIVEAYAMAHHKYKAAHGLLDYRLLQVTSRLLPVGAPPIEA